MPQVLEHASKFAGADGVKILHVTLDLPYPPMRGAQMRDYGLISRAAQIHEVAVVSFCEESVQLGDVAEMRRICPDTCVVVRPKMGLLTKLAHTSCLWLSGLPPATAHYVYAEVEAQIKTRLDQRDVDILQIEHSFLAPYVRAAEGVVGVRTVLSLHNVGAVQYPRMVAIETGLKNQLIARIKAALMQGWEAKWADRFDQVVTVSENDAKALRDMGVKTEITVVPNGIEPRPAPLPPGVGRNLVFVGNLRYPPNQDAARFMVSEVMPRLHRHDPGITLTIAGFDPPEDMLDGLSLDGVEVIANAPELIALYEAACVVVVPLRAGGGTRIKILEAMALGRPVVATPVGAEGLDLVHGETVLFAKEADEFAAMVARLVADPSLQAYLVANGRRMIDSRYNWDVVWSQLAAVYDRANAARFAAAEDASPAAQSPD